MKGYSQMIHSNLFRFWIGFFNEKSRWSQLNFPTRSICSRNIILTRQPGRNTVVSLYFFQSISYKRSLLLLVILKLDTILSLNRLWFGGITRWSWTTFLVPDWLSPLDHGYWFLVVWQSSVAILGSLTGLGGFWQLTHKSFILERKSQRCSHVQCF